VRPTCKCTPAPVTATVGCASEPTRAQHQQYDPTKEEVAAPSSNENHTLQPKKKNTAFLSPLHIPAQHASSHGLWDGFIHRTGKENQAGFPVRPSSREHESSPLFWGSHTVLKSVLCHKERPSGDPPSTSAVHTLPLSHAPRRESGAPHRFPGHAHRAAPHPRARVVKPPVSSQAEFLRQPWAQAGSEPGVRALGVAQRPRAHASAPGGAPEAPPMQPFPNSRAWEKRFFTRSIQQLSLARVVRI